MKAVENALQIDRLVMATCLGRMARVREDDEQGREHRQHEGDKEARDGWT